MDNKKTEEDFNKPDSDLYDEENGTDFDQYEDSFGLNEDEISRIRFTVQCIKNPFPEDSDEWLIVQALQKEKPEGYEELKYVLMSLFDFDNFDMTPDEYTKEILYFMIENRVIKLD